MIGDKLLGSIQLQIKFIVAIKRLLRIKPK